MLGHKSLRTTQHYAKILDLKVSQDMGALREKMNLVKILAQAQNLNLKEYDIFIADTLINKSEFLEKGKDLDSGRLKYLTFKPITDGQKKYTI